jgi:hypothetical protein
MIRKQLINDEGLVATTKKREREGLFEEKFFNK